MALASDDLETLLDDVLRDDREDAWERLVGRLHPLIVAMCRRRQLVGGAGDLEDARRDVAVRTLDRLRRDDCAALRRFVDARAHRPELRFVSWLAAVVSHTYVDYIRSLPEMQRRRVDGERRLQRLAVEPGDGDALPSGATDVPTAVEVRRILACIASDEFPRPQREALALWLRGCDHDEIARALGLGDEGEARKLLRAARQRLRRAILGGQR